MAHSGQMAASQALAALHTQGCDFLRVQGNSELIKFLDKSAKAGGNVESVQFSDSVLKINRRGVQQKRDLVITSSTVYNFKSRSYKAAQRAIPIPSLRGVLLSRSGEEALLQVRGGYDYRLLIVRQADAIRILTELFELHTGNKLPVEVVPDISKCQVLKADITKGDGGVAGGGEEEGSPRAAGGPSSTASTPMTATAGGAGGIHGRNFSFGGAGSSNASPAAAAAGLELKPSMEGWLAKKGQVNLLWRRRYFRLSESNLLYYEARLKGTTELVSGGDVRVWVNKRLSMNVSAQIDNARSSSNHAVALAASASNTLAPLLYEFKLSSSYGITPASHLKDILSDPERLASFVVYCESTKPPASATASNQTPGGTTRRAPNESGHPKFYAAVEKFKLLWPGTGTASSAASANSWGTGARGGFGSPASMEPITPEEQLAEARDIYQRYVGPEAVLPINAPLAFRDAVGDALARQSTLRRQTTMQQQKQKNAAASSSAAGGKKGAVSPSSFPSSGPDQSPPPSSAALHPDLFQFLQSAALEYMESHVLPGYLLHSRASEARIVRDFRLKTELNDTDKRRPACFNCLSSFGLLKRRHFCRYCGDVFCGSCLTKSTRLPPEYGVPDEIKVCDMCSGVLEIGENHPHAFSYAVRGRGRPINLAASSPQELQGWVSALRMCIEQKAAAAGSGGGGSNGSNSGAGRDSFSAPSANGTVLTSGSPGHKEGWLMKEDPTTKIWRRRYFILNGVSGHLYYYELNLKGSLSLAQGAGVHSTTTKATLSPTDSSFGGVASRSGFACRFTISYQQRLYALAADSTESMEKWMEALQKVIRRKPGAGGLSALMQAREAPTAAAGAMAAPTPTAAAGANNATSAGAGHGQMSVGSMGPSSPLHGALGSPPLASSALSHTLPASSPSNANAAAASANVASAEAYSSSFAQRAPENEVAFVFTDVQNSTKLWESAPDAMNIALEKHDALLRALLVVFKGYEVKTEGDAFMVTFFSALDAVRWCLACQQALLDTVWPDEVLAQPSARREERSGRVVFNGVRIRMGIHVGHPACRRNPITGRMDYFGPVVNRSARVSDSAHGGQVVCTQEVRDMVQAALEEGKEFPMRPTAPILASMGFHRYKGISEMVQVFQIYNENLAGRNPFPELRTTKADEGAEAAALLAATTLGSGTTVGAGGVQQSLSPSTPSVSPTHALVPGSVPSSSSSGAAGVSLAACVSKDTDDDEFDFAPPPPPLTPDTDAATTTVRTPVALGAQSMVSPSRPSHLTVPSISAMSIHPYTPSAAAAVGATRGGPAAGAANAATGGGFDSDSDSRPHHSRNPAASDDSDESDEDEDEEDAADAAEAQAERMLRLQQLQQSAGIVTPPPFQSPSPPITPPPPPAPDSDDD